MELRTFLFLCTVHIFHVNSLLGIYVLCCEHLKCNCQLNLAWMPEIPSVYNCFLIVLKMGVIPFRRHGCDIICLCRKIPIYPIKC